MPMGNIFSAVGGALARGGKGAIAGAGLGFLNTGDMYGAAGGAVAGGLFGGLGMPAISRFAGNRGLSVAGVGRTALGYGIRGARGARRGMTGIAANQLAGGGVNRLGIAAGYGADVMRGVGGGLAGARGYLGKNAATVNKFGGMGLNESVLIGIGMVPRMEVALIVVTIAISYNILKGEIAHQLLAVTLLLTIVTTIITPFLIKLKALRESK